MATFRLCRKTVGCCHSAHNLALFCAKTYKLGSRCRRTCCFGSETVICFMVYVITLFQQYGLCGAEWYSDIILRGNCWFPLLAAGLLYWRSPLDLPHAQRSNGWKRLEVVVRENNDPVEWSVKMSCKGMEGTRDAYMFPWRDLWGHPVTRSPFEPVTKQGSSGIKMRLLGNTCSWWFHRAWN